MGFLTFLVMAVPFGGGLLACRLGGSVAGTLLGLVVFAPVFFGMLHLHALFPEWGPPPSMADAFAQARQLIGAKAAWWLPSYLFGAFAGYALDRLTRRPDGAAQLTARDEE